MLTGKSVSPTRVAEYFVQGHYLDLKGNSRWFGEAAKKLGLSGAVDNEEVFNHVVNGYSPDGQTQLSARTIDTFERRAASDLTFSAPKSVSLTALVGGDYSLITAHNIAVEKTLALIEQRYAHTRVTIDDHRQVVNTGNLVIAEFDHIESRELDPHLHTHCLVMNMTEVEGKWYSHHNDAIYSHKKYLGMMYQSFLAQQVQKLGYKIKPLSHGQFEIQGYKPQDLKEFSKRREQILAAAGPHSSWSEREKYWAATRKRKEKFDPDELKVKWQKQARDLGITIEQPQPRSDWQAVAVQQHHLDDAIAHCTERNVAFYTEDLEKFILEQNLATDLSGLGSLIAQNTELRTIHNRYRGYFTTAKALQREAETLALMHDGQGNVSLIAQKEVVQHYLDSTTLNQGQRQAVELAATTTDQFVAWQGVAGAGKTFALKEFQSIAHSNGYTVKGFAPSSQAAKVLGQELGIQGETVARLLVWDPTQDIEPNQIWIVDEAGLLSAKAAHQLLERATTEKARVVLVGDTKQLSAVEAGSPFKSLQKAGIKTAYLNQSLRQRTPPLKLVVDLIADDKIEQSFARLQDYGYIQTVTPDQKVEAIATEYMSIALSERAKTLVLAGTNNERLALTLAIRNQMKVEGTLGEESTGTQLKAKDLSTVQMGYTHNFELGDVVIPTRSYKRRGLEKGELYQVVGKSEDTLTLKTADGRQLEVNTDFHKAVYQPQEIEIAVGDRLKWTKNDRLTLRRNGQEFVVKAMTGNSATIEYLEDNHSETINLDSAQHFDYAIVSTIHSSQGKTADRVLVAADYTLFKENFYVAVSRAKYDLKLYTESPQKMLERALQSKAKQNPSDLIAHNPQKAVAEHTVARTSPPIQRYESGVTTIPTYEPSHDEDLKSHPVQQHESGVTTAKSSVTTIPTYEHPVQKPTIPVIQQTPTPPEWLAQGQRVFYKNQGWGEVEALNGSSVSIKLDSGEIKHLVQWHKAVDSQSIIPEPTTPFWVNNDTQEAPTHIEPEHWHELVQDSSIHPDIAALNFKSLKLDSLEQEHEAWAHLMYSFKLERSNTGRLTSGMLRRYAHIDAGGWWADAGVDPREFHATQPGHKPSAKIWGCFKPNTPRSNPDKPGKKIKYEHPPKTDLSIFLLDVPSALANRIYEKAGVNPTQNERNSGFWYCVHKYNLPVTITEGAKKAASLLSQGHAAIGLPGIYAGYRSKDEQGNEVKARLHDELAVFATPERDIKICFDYETRPETKRNIDIAIFRTGSLLQRTGAKVSVVTLPGPDKGVDDFIVAHGGQAYEKLSLSAKSLKDWRDYNKKLQHQLPKPPTLLKHPHNQTVDAISEHINDHNAQQLHQQKLESIKQLSNHDLLEMDESIARYFHSNISRTPLLPDKHFIKTEIDRLDEEIDELWTNKEQLEKQIESIQSNPFKAFTFDNKYSDILLQTGSILQKISDKLDQKKQFEQQLTEWEQHALNHQSWLNDPRTEEMRIMAQVFTLPEIKQRLSTAFQEKELHRQQQLAEYQRSIEQSAPSGSSKVTHSKVTGATTTVSPSR